MEEKQCEIQRGHLKERIDRNETRLNNHSDRIDKLEQYRSSVEKQLENLVEQVANLVSIMKWFMGLFIGAFISFFFYAVQNGLFK